ncbi:MAG: 3-oxoacyl-[acyl-carrier-protein] reductase [Bacteroidota bacterium]
MPVSLDLSGKTVLVTGGTRGIGRAVVEAAAEAGATVAFTYRSSTETARDLVDRLGGADKALAIQADAASADDAAAAVEAVTAKWGAIDGLVVNAGITRDGLMIRMDADAWQAVIDTNLTGAFHVAKAAYRPMMRQRSGSIVTVSSVVGVTGNAGQANYAASKAGLIGFTKSLARELGGRGVRANVVAPGYIETDMTAELGEGVTEAMKGQIPLGRLGAPGDIAAAVLFLLSDASTYVTGHVLHVDGGMAM